ncbi:MAG: hypothetical protein Q9160_006655 [Pyrenula sp. 1 TL-2023]
MSKKHIVVAGGTGFLGSRICNRSGEPHWPSITSSATPPPWSTSITWAKADILNPQTYTPYLSSPTPPTAVIHTMGILLEADYKSVLTGRESPFSGLRRAFSASKPGASSNPLDRSPSTPLTDEPPHQLTYELMNRDSAISLAKASHAASIPTFIYISAAAGAPILPSRYITTKREAESTIASSIPQLRSIFFRPAFLYDSSRAFTLPIALSGRIGSAVNGVVGGWLTNYLGSIVEKPLRADEVAEAVVEAVEREEVRGVVGGGEIEGLANKAWRRGML